MGPALAWLNKPVAGALGCYVCASNLKAHYRKSQGSIYFQVGKLLSKDLSFLQPPPPPQELIADVLFPKRVWYRKNFRQLMVNVYRFFHHHRPQCSASTNRTLGKIPFQARTASSLFSFSVNFCRDWFVILFTDHTKPLESLMYQSFPSLAIPLGESF